MGTDFEKPWHIIGIIKQIKNNMSQTRGKKYNNLVTK